MNSLPQLFENNRNWAKQINAEDPDFFSKLSKQQSPKYLWIGCADSRVPANQITGLMPGDIFVHRNIANLVVHTDLNLLSVLQYAVDALKIEHIIICGHYGCGGVRAALEDQPHGLVDNWLRNIEDVAEANLEILNPLEKDARVDRLCELNVLHQAKNLSRTTVLQEAWTRKQSVDIHSWIYSLEDGHIRTLAETINSYTPPRSSL
ncbi:MAG: carbonic anhydrase [Lentimonas sp.]|jgi:carbonic anhydrase